MMDKAINNINCGDVSDRQQSLILAEDFTNMTSTYQNVTGNDTNNWDPREFNSTNHDFEMEVCRAERESQKLGSSISAYIAPFGIV